MPPRFFVDLPLRAGAALALPSGAARHVQVLRLQPGAPITLFDGQGGEWAANVARIGRSEVAVEVGDWRDVDRELGLEVTLALGMPANERMDTLIEKATELGAARIQPLVCERSVLRLAGDRAQKKVAHWQAVAVAACEQSGRTRCPVVAPIATLPAWLAELPVTDAALRLLLSAPRPAQAVRPPGGAREVATPHFLESPREGGSMPTVDAAGAVVVLSGPEGGLSDAEEAAACRAGFVPVSLGPRILRADTAPLAALARLGGEVGATPDR